MRVKAGVLLVVALGVGGLCWFVTRVLADIASDRNVELSTFASWCLGHPVLVALLAVGAVLCALAGMFARRLSWLLVMLVALAALIPVGVVLVCFLQVVMPMYQYQPL